MDTYIIVVSATFLFTTVFTIGGVGAAFILVPIFLILGIPHLTAISTALPLNSIAMIFASMSYAKEKLIVFRTAIPFIIFASIFALLGAVTTKYISRYGLLWIFVGFLIFTASMMLFYKPKEKQIEANTRKLAISGIGAGSFAGYLGGLLGVGGGKLIVPVLIWLGFNPKKASATTAFIVIFSSFFGFLGHTAQGNIDLKLLSLCLIGAIPGALLGAYLMKKLSVKQVNFAIAIMLYIISAHMVWDLLK